VAVLDRTEWHFGKTPVNVLMMGIAHKGIAFPVAWKVLPSGGGSGTESHVDVLERFLSIVDPASIEAVLADREFISVDWMDHLQENNIPFAIRLRSDRKVGLSPEGPSLPVRMFGRPIPPGEEKILEGERYLCGSQELGEKKHVSVRVVIRRIGSEGNSGDAEDPFLILATSGLDSSGLDSSGLDSNEATSLYRRRWEIETMFAALKSRGFNLEETHITAPDRVQRLIGLLALGFGWTHLAGEKRAAREGPPPEKPHGRRARSLFRYGLDWLQSILTTPEKQNAALFLCLSGLRSPSTFLAAG